MSKKRVTAVAIALPRATESIRLLLAIFESKMADAQAERVGKFAITPVRLCAGYLQVRRAYHDAHTIEYLYEIMHVLYEIIHTLYEIMHVLYEIIHTLYVIFYALCETIHALYEII